MFYVYVLESQKNSRLYKGFTNDLDKRIAVHNSGKNVSTKGFRPWKLVYVEEFENLNEAIKRGDIKKGGTLVEATSGNTGIALAFIAYALIRIFTGKFGKTSPAIWVIAAASVLSFYIA